MSQLFDDSYYAGDDGKGECLFVLKSWIEFQQQLAAAEVVMRIAATKCEMEFLGNIRGSWPARRLRKRVGFEEVEIRLMLNANYFQNGEVFYELHRNVVRKRFGLFRKDVKHEQIARYSAEQMRDHDLLAKDLESLILTVLPRRRS